MQPQAKSNLLIQSQTRCRCAIPPLRPYTLGRAVVGAQVAVCPVPCRIVASVRFAVVRSRVGCGLKRGTVCSMTGFGKHGASGALCSPLTLHHDALAGGSRPRCLLEREFAEIRLARKPAPAAENNSSIAAIANRMPPVRFSRRQQHRWSKSATQPRNASKLTITGC